MGKQLATRRTAWIEILKRLDRGNYAFSTLFPIVAATYVTRKWPEDPLWVNLIGPPGAGKTTTMMLFAKAPQVMIVGDLTPASLITAWGGADHDPSIFAKVDQHLLMVTDFSSIMALGWERERQVLALLRRAYDGVVSKDFAMLRREYTLHFNFVGAATEVFDSHAATTQELGERFTKYRPETLTLPWPPQPLGAKLPDKVAAWLEWIEEQQRKHPVCIDPPATLYDIAELTALMRTEVMHDYRTHDISEIPHAERPIRLSKQLVKLFGGILVITGDPDEALATCVRVALGTIPPRRVSIFDSLIREPGLSTNDLANRMRLGYTVMRYLTSDMAALGLLEHSPGSHTKSYSWRVPPDLETVYMGLFGS